MRLAPTLPARGWRLAAPILPRYRGLLSKVGAQHAATPPPPAVDFVPAQFVVPLEYSFKELSLIKLVPDLVESDYEAVMGSRLSSNMSSVFAANDVWPSASMTIEEDVLDLRRHEIEFDLRLAFAYTVVARRARDDVALPRTLGCVYINPATRVNYDAEVFWWSVSHGLAPSDDGWSAATLAADVEEMVRSWIAEAWPFEAVAYPGRDHMWVTFGQTPFRDVAVPRIGEDAKTVVRAAWRSCGLARLSREGEFPMEPPTVP